MDTTRRHLTELASLSHKTEQAERNILARAESALERCQADITRLRPVAMVPGAAEAQEFRRKARPIEAEWVEDMNKRGFDGRKLLDTARALIEKNTKTTKS